MPLQDILRIRDYTRIDDYSRSAILRNAHYGFWGLNQAQDILAVLEQQRQLVSFHRPLSYSNSRLTSTWDTHAWAIVCWVPPELNQQVKPIGKGSLVAHYAFTHGFDECAP
jgi:hypothetical protein